MSDDLEGKSQASADSSSPTSPSPCPELSQDTSEVLVQRLHAAAEDAHAGVSVPISVGYWSLDNYQQILAKCPSCWKVSWGVATDGEPAAYTDDDVALVLFWGDPSRPHEKLTAAFRLLVRENLRLHPYPIYCEGSTDTMLSSASTKHTDGTDDSNRKRRQFIKQPDAAWSLTAEDAPMTVLEVVWGGDETNAKCQQEFNLWRENGFNVILLRAWWEGASGNAATLRKAGSIGDSLEEWKREVSILLMAQGIDETRRRVWRMGSKAEAMDLPTDVDVVEEKGSFSALPSHWFVERSEEISLAIPIVLDYFVENLASVLRREVVTPRTREEKRRQNKEMEVRRVEKELEAINSAEGQKMGLGGKEEVDFRERRLRAMRSGLAKQ